jgi:hypothetical protein
MLRQAAVERAIDPKAAATLETNGRAYMATWRCPNLPAEARPREPLSPPCAEALARVAMVTGAKGVSTCPHYATRAAWVHRVVQARRWREHGHLTDRYGALTQALAEALEAVDAGVSARERDDDERREKRSKAK